MSDDGGLDVTGVGKLAKAIPQKAWIQLVDTACITFREAIAPLTTISSGFGRLITAKFDRLVDAEKVLAAENVVKHKTKTQRASALLPSHQKQTSSSPQLKLPEFKRIFCCESYGPIFSPKNWSLPIFTLSFLISFQG